MGVPADEVSADIAVEVEATAEEESPAGETSETEATGATQPLSTEELNQVIAGRINRVNTKYEKANEATEAAQRQLEFKEEEIKNLLLRNQQLEQVGASKVSERPDPDKFDDGVHDPAYETARNHYEDQRHDELVGHIAESNKVTQAGNAETERARLLESQRQQHYQRVRGLGDGAKGYLERETAAEEILGAKTVDDIIRVMPNSEEALSALGAKANVAQAQRIAGLLKDGGESGAALALIEIGRLMSPGTKTKAKTAPDPDEEIPGSSTTSAKLKRGPPGAKYE